MKKYNTSDIKRTARIGALLDDLFAKMPEIEADRAV